ncbi:MAG: 2-oxoacid:acceptor oxidoreductase family protein [Candidatus Aenigmatarchaeota archaeon]
MTLNIRIYGTKYANICGDMISKAISGFFVQKWSECGVSYLKADKMPIHDRGPVSEPNFVLICDLIEVDKSALKNLPRECVVIINTQEKSAPLVLKKQRIKTILIDATGIAMTHTSEPNPVVPMIAALVKKTNDISLKNFEAMLKQISPKDGSIAAAEEAHKLVR